MTKPIILVIYIITLVVIIVAVDVLFFKTQFWPRLLSNIGIVLVFAVFQLRFLK